MKYAGIGARKTPLEILEWFDTFAQYVGGSGVLLRSGAATGADSYFERGCDAVNGRKEIYRAADTVGRFDWFECAEKHHPAWGACSEYAQRLHARNCPIILGNNLQDPVDFVVCWTVGGRVMGGTGQSMRVAMSHNVPVFNFGLDGAFDALRSFLKSQGVSA